MGSPMSGQCFLGKQWEQENKITRSNQQVTLQALGPPGSLTLLTPTDDHPLSHRNSTYPLSSFSGDLLEKVDVV